MNRNNNNQQQQVNLPSLSDIINPIPFTLRFFYFIWIILWLMSIIFSEALSYLTNSFSNTIFKFRFWTIFTNVFYESSFFILSIVIFNSWSFFPKMEIKYGSAYLFSQIIIMSTVIQLLVLGIQSLYYLIFGQLYQSNNGILGIWAYFMILFCFYNPAEIKFCCFGWRFSRKAYPWILIGFICLFSWEIRSQLIIGTLLGLISFFLFSNFKILNSCLYEKVNKIFQMMSLNKFECYMSLKIDDGVKNEMQHLQKYQGGSSRITSVGNDSFTGKKGYRLSGQDS